MIKRQLFCSERLWQLKSTYTLPMLHEVKKPALKTRHRRGQMTEIVFVFEDQIGF